MTSQLDQPLTEEDIEEWLESDSNDLGYEHLDDAGIVAMYWIILTISQRIKWSLMKKQKLLSHLV